ncbi:MAG: antibiotic biosynthesis monooxygenase [Deltaproteobacteria bacterium]|jgi:quinol monooxygenase YgiN|nr:antibiotic biosynthesis monooxygenase [Deltaproteobacteria bacterium]MBW2495638.1 antibiotic biosynthesis monooxygenase [Deltaproteobacteria bacterium]
MSIRLTVQLTVQEGKSAEFEAAAGPALARVRAEDKGCEMYDLFKSVDDDSRFVVVESWASQEDLDAHMKSPAMGDVGKALGAFMGGAPTMHKYED